MIEYSIQKLPFRKSWALWRRDESGMRPMAYFVSEDAAKLVHKEFVILTNQSEEAQNDD